MKFIRNVDNERGMALVTTLMFLTILFFLGVAAYLITSNDLKISGYYRLSQSAFYVAESGIEEAKGRLKIIYVDQFVDPGTATQDENWRYFIGDSTLAGELGYIAGTHPLLSGFQTGMNYAVMLRFKTGADPNSAGITSASQIVYWGDTDGDGLDEESAVDSNDTYPIFIATCLGTSGGARKQITSDIRGISAFLDAPAALYVNGNLTKNGVAGSAVGAYDPSCPSVPDVMTTVNATAPYDADSWPAATSADPPINGTAWLESGIVDLYPVDEVMEVISSSYDQLTSSGNNQVLGSEDSPGIFYCDGDWSGNNLDGYGVLAINGNFTVGGNIEWHGLIIVTGETIFDGGGVQEVYGAVIADTVTTINGTPDINYDCSFLGDLKDLSPKFQAYTWKEEL